MRSVNFRFECWAVTLVVVVSGSPNPCSLTAQAAAGKDDEEPSFLHDLALASIVPLVEVSGWVKRVGDDGLSKGWSLADLSASMRTPTDPQR